MAKKKSKPATFGAALFAVRQGRFVHRTTIAEPAGITARMLADMEEGRVPFSGAVYDEAVAQFPALASFPRPDDVVRTSLPTNPAVSSYMEHLRPLMDVLGRIRVGKNNRMLIRRAIEMTMTGDYTLVEIDLCLPV